jgi:hypothetical protein
MGDVDGDNVYDLVVGPAGDYAPTIAVYSGKSADDKSPFATEIARFPAFDPSARGGVSVTVSQIDGTTADNIIVGSGSGMPSEVKVFGTELPSSPGTVPPLFAAFSPYPGDTSGVTVASGFVDFTTGRNSIITAPGPGTPTQVKVFTMSLMKPLKARSASTATPKQCPGPKEAAVTAAFMPFGLGYTGGVSLTTGWLTGPQGGARAIVVGQLSDPGGVKVYSSGSMLQGGPRGYLQSFSAHSVPPVFTDIARFTPFEDVSGVRVATTSTTIGADLLVSGISRTDRSVKVRKYQLFKPAADASVLEAKEIGEVSSMTGAFPNALGGD